MRWALINLFFSFPESSQVSDVWYGCTLNYIHIYSHGLYSLVMGLLIQNYKGALLFHSIELISAEVESILEHIYWWIAFQSNIKHF